MPHLNARFILVCFTYNKGVLTVIVYRVETKNKVGPIFGCKGIKKEWFDYRDSEVFKRSNLKEEELYGYEDVEIPFDSKNAIVKHKTPRENKPFFIDRIYNRYSFGWRSHKRCRKFIKAGIKNKWILHKEDFSITEYFVNDAILFPDGQVAFDLKKAKLKKRHRNSFTR